MGVFLACYILTYANIFSFTIKQLCRLLYIPRSQNYSFQVREVQLSLRSVMISRYVKVHFSTDEQMQRLWSFMRKHEKMI